MKRLLFIALVLAACAAVAPNPPDVDLLQVISLDSGQFSAARLSSLGLDVFLEKSGRVYVVSTARDRERLGAQGILFAAEPAFSGLPSSGPIPAGGGINGDYHTYRELEQDLRALEASYPGLARVHELGRSLEGRNIYGLKISDNVGVEEAEAQALFLGCHHAREWISVEVPYLLGHYLLENYQSDPRVRGIVDHSEVWVVPLVNPDGLEYSIHVYRYWRKNRRFNDDESFGVDLNRNYGFQWGIDNTGSSPIPDSGVYRGTAAFSEPETAAVRDFVNSRSFLALISYHSYTQVILYPWGYVRKPVENADRMKYLAAGMSQRMEAVRGTEYSYGQSSYMSYLVNGDTTDWAFGIHGIPAYTIELPPPNEQGGGFFNAESEILPIFNENLEAALYLIEDCISEYQPPSADGKIIGLTPPGKSSGGERPWKR